MKIIILSLLSASLLQDAAYSQDLNICNNKKIISPLVPKPQHDTLISVTCNALTISWERTDQLSPEVGVTSYNEQTNKVDTVMASKISCSSKVCQATIPVIPGARVTWQIQNTKVLNGRLFYSYKLLGRRSITIPACDKKNATLVTTPAIVIPGKGAAEKNEIHNLDRLKIYPNPTSGSISVEWTSKYRGNAKIVVLDGGGKEILWQLVFKNNTTFLVHLNIESLSKGLYYIRIDSFNGNSVISRFIKK